MHSFTCIYELVVHHCNMPLLALLLSKAANAVLLRQTFAVYYASYNMPATYSRILTKLEQQPWMPNLCPLHLDHLQHTTALLPNKLRRTAACFAVALTNWTGSLLFKPLVQTRLVKLVTAMQTA